MILFLSAFHISGNSFIMRSSLWPLYLLNRSTHHLCSAAAAPKSLQSCPTLCDPIDGSPPGSSVPGILQARTLEWVAISFSNVWRWKVKVKLISRVWLFATPWTAAYQAPPSIGVSRQEYWSGLLLPSPEPPLFILLLNCFSDPLSFTFQLLNLGPHSDSQRRATGCKGPLLPGSPWELAISSRELTGLLALQKSLRAACNPEGQV